MRKRDSESLAAAYLMLDVASIARLVLELERGRDKIEKITVFKENNAWLAEVDLTGPPAAFDAQGETLPLLLDDIIDKLEMNS